MQAELYGVSRDGISAVLRSRYGRSVLALTIIIVELTSSLASTVSISGETEYPPGTEEGLRFNEGKTKRNTR